jgi:fucose 4-O-acetylase-like acetyltransferase
MLPFIYVGYLLRKHDLLDNINLTAMILFLVAGVYIAFFNGTSAIAVTYATNSVAIFPFSLITGIFISTAILWSFNAIKKTSKIFEFFGRSSLLILGLNFCVYYLVNDL